MTSFSLAGGIQDMSWNSSGSNYNTYRVQILSDSTVIMFLSNGSQDYNARTYTEVMRITPGGLVSFGSASLTARLNLPSGTTSIAPLLISSGALLTTAVSGAIENDSTYLYYTSGVAGRNPIVVAASSSIVSGRIPYWASNTLTSSANMSYNGTTLSLSSTNTTTTSLLQMLTSLMTGSNETRCLVGRTTTSCLNLFFDGTLAGIKNNNFSSVYLALNSSGNVRANTTIQSYSLTPFFSSTVTGTNIWANIGNLVLGTNQQAMLNIQTNNGLCSIQVRNTTSYAGQFWSIPTSQIDGCGMDVNNDIWVFVNATTQLDIYVQTTGVWNPYSPFTTAASVTLTTTFTSGYGITVASSGTKYTPLSIAWPGSVTGYPITSNGINVTTGNLLVSGLGTGGVPSSGLGTIVTIGNGRSLGWSSPNLWLSVASSSESIQFYTGSTVTTSFQNGLMTTTNDVVAFGSISDRRLKTDVEDLKSEESVVNRLRPIRFKWRDDIFNESKRGKSDVGFIAQEVEEVIPEVIIEMSIDDMSFKGIKYEKLIPHLVKHIQDLTVKVDRLTEIVEKMKHG